MSTINRTVFCKLFNWFSKLSYICFLSKNVLVMLAQNYITNIYQ